MARENQLKDKIALITGAASGIGKACVDRFLLEGAMVVASDLNISETIEYHQKHGRLATVTAVYPPARFGALELNKNKVVSFKEKPPGDGNWINGGYFVLEPGVFDYLENDSTVWENEPVENLSQKNQLSAYRHSGFWQPLDTLRDKNKLEDLWLTGNAPWKTW